MKFSIVFFALSCLLATSYATSSILGDMFNCDPKCGFKSCKSCLGNSHCCGDAKNSEYGLCKSHSSVVPKCPDGSTFICSGSKCSPDINCKVVKSYSSGSSWGTTACKTVTLGFLQWKTCPSGFKEGLFCKWDSKTKQVYVCGTPNPSPPPLSPLPPTSGSPINCVVSSWSDVGACNPTTGLQVQTRSISTYPSKSGSLCPPLERLVACSVDCKVGDWGYWSPCLGTNQTRTRPVLVHPLNGGTACPVLGETQSCVGCGAELVQFVCHLSTSQSTTACTLPGGALTVVIVNKPGYKKALVRVNAKPVAYQK